MIQYTVFVLEFFLAAFFWWQYSKDKSGYDFFCAVCWTFCTLSSIIILIKP